MNTYLFHLHFNSKTIIRLAFVLLLVLNCITPTTAQHTSDLNFPVEYIQLKSDTARLRYLIKTISDSLDEDQLTHIYNWSRAGLTMAENNNIDTMKGIFNFYIAKAYAYRILNLDSAIVYYKKVLPYFPDRKRKYNVFSIREIMERYCEKGNKDSSFVYLNILRAYIDTMPDTSPKKISLCQNIATVYQWFGMFKTASHFYRIAIYGSRRNGNIKMLGLALANFSEMNAEADNNQKAIFYGKEALNYLEGVNMPYMKTASNIATFYTALSQYNSALVYLQKSDSIAKINSDIQQQIANQGILADIYTGQKKYASARTLFEKTLIDLKNNNDRPTIAKSYISLAVLDSTMHRYAEAKSNLLRGLKIAAEDKQQPLIVTAFQKLAAVSAKMNDYKSAYEYQQSYLEANDSMTNEKTKSEMSDIEIGYETLQKEQYIQLLQRDNDIKFLQLKNSRQILYSYIAGFAALILIAAVVFYHRNRRHSIQIGKIQSELQTQILRSQMNPHFIFNCLNSIENFIMRNDKRQASDYLNKFSRLIRSILDGNDVVPIAKDMEALKLYVELEQLRFNNKFNYKVFVDPALAGGDYRVPSLLIQPFVENAIVHGLAHSEEDGLNLTVTASLENDRIKYMIQDNGIGRAKAHAYNLHNKPYHKSVGLKITENRIQIFNREQKGDQIRIIDLYDKNSKPDGTKVEIILKAI